MEYNRDAIARGEFRCPTCGFRLSQRSLRASDGAVGERDQPGEKCPNDGRPLWRMSIAELDAEQEAIRYSIRRRMMADRSEASGNAERTEELNVPKPRG